MHLKHPVDCLFCLRIFEIAAYTKDTIREFLLIGRFLSIRQQIVRVVGMPVQPFLFPFSSPCLLIEAERKIKRLASRNKRNEINGHDGREEIAYAPQLFFSLWFREGGAKR